jgi:Lon protease-like protein
MSAIPMFPLGTVLFPGAVLPLQVFEPRYRELVGEVLAGENRFGVVLIERGSEVGGGDMRTAVGTIAEIVRTGEAEDGRILVVAVGKDRFRVVEWFDDDPYPLAAVEVFADTESNGRLAPLVAQARAARRRLLALAVEMGAEGQRLDLDLPDDPLQASWALCAAAPVGPFDRQALLETASGYERMSLLARMLVEQTEDLEIALRET